METAPGTYEEHVAVGVVNELNELYTSPAHLTLSCKFYKQMKIFASDSTILHQLEPSVVAVSLYTDAITYRGTPLHRCAMEGAHSMREGGGGVSLGLDSGERERGGWPWPWLPAGCPWATGS